MNIIKPVKLSRVPRQQYTKLMCRANEQYDKVLARIKPVISDIQNNGDKSVSKYALKFDKVNLSAKEFVIDKAGIDFRYARLVKSGEYKNLIQSIKHSYNNIYSFHKKQLIKEKYSPVLGRLMRPIEKVAVYVPHGTAVYPSTLLMGVIPAKIAGVSEVTVATKCNPDKSLPAGIIIAAKIAGVDRIVRIGGVQSIAALAYGTGTIPKVDKIIGPGNVYVNTAKIYLNSIGAVAIDFSAGPSEVLIIADDTAVPEYVAWDMISQAEHDENASAVLVTASEKLAKSVSDRINGIVNDIISREGNATGRKAGSIIRKSLVNYGAIIIAGNIDAAVKFANNYAPEHLQIITAGYKKVLDKISNAGSIFIGNYSPVAAGDYITGTNHILPTGGAARYVSGISVDTFLRKPTYQMLAKSGLKAYNKTIAVLSEYEGLSAAHGNSVRIRIAN